MTLPETEYYRYVPGSRFAADGVAAAPGTVISRAAFAELRSWDDGFRDIEAHLAARGLLPAALCGIELRMPAALPFEDFRALNDDYLARLNAWSLLRDGKSTFARTNVCPSGAVVGGPSVAAFSFAHPGESAATCYVVSGIAELPPGAPFPAGVTAPGDLSPDGVRAKATTITSIIVDTIDALGTRWSPADTVNLYCTHDVGRIVLRDVLPTHGVIPNDGLVCYDAAPPTHGIDIELDVRRYANRYQI